MAFDPDPPRKFWVTPEGTLRLVRFGQHHLEQVPPEVMPQPRYDPRDVTDWDGGEENELKAMCAASGYYIATLLNERLYVQSFPGHSIPRRVVKLLEDMCIEKGWERGVVVEEL